MSIIGLEVRRVGLLGLGTVGRGVRDLVPRLGFEVAGVLVREPGRPHTTTDAAAFLADDYDVVVEAIGGVEPAATLVAQVLRKGIPVVTANKALLAERGAELQALAAAHGTVLRGEAAVGGGIPLLSLLEHSLHSSRIVSVTAILNGTSNFVLTRVDRDGTRLGEAVEEAQRCGFAEADPSLDLNGTDAAQKLRVLVRALGGELERVETTGLASVRPRDCRHARALGYAIKPVAHTDLTRGFVAPALLPLDHPLAGLRDEQCGVAVTGDPVGTLFVAGPGAGGPPTASAIADDLLAIARGAKTPPRPRPQPVPAREHGRYLSVELLAGEPDTALALLADHGVVLRRLVPTARGFAAITAPADLTAARRALGALRSVSDIRALRVLDQE